jgi:hypothetical protein
MHFYEETVGQQEGERFFELVAAAGLRRRSLVWLDCRRRFLLFEPGAAVVIYNLTLPTGY